MKIPLWVEDLEIGMFVAELDRPWVGTPFLFQGILIDSDDTITILSNLCRYVFVDDARSGSDRRIRNKLSTARNSSQGIEFKRWDQLDGLKQSMRRLLDTTHSAAADFRRYLIDHDSEHLVHVDNAIAEITQRVERDPVASLWIALLHDYDEEVSKHAMGTCALAIGFATHLGWDTDLRHVVGMGALLHDIGMTRIPAWLLSKKSNLAPTERSLLQLHPQYGASLLKAYAGCDPRIIEIVSCHHERRDGSGYPFGLRGTEFEDYVQLVAICELFDSYTHDQPYRRAMSGSQALVELTHRADRHFNRWLVEAFIRWIGIYPLGSLVRMQDGCLGIVVTSDEARRLQPIVLIAKDSSGILVRPRSVRNLKLLGEADIPGKFAIQEIVDPVEEGIDIAEVLREEIDLR